MESVHKLNEFSDQTNYLPPPLGTNPPPFDDPILDSLLAKLENLFCKARHRLETSEPRPPAIDPDLVIDHVARQLYVDRELILSAARTQRVSFVRQVCMYLCRELTGNSWHVLGRHFGRDHATVLHGVNAIRQRMADPVHGPAFTKLIEQLQAQITTTLSAPPRAAA